MLPALVEKRPLDSCIHDVYNIQKRNEKEKQRATYALPPR